MPWKGEKDPYKIWLSEVILQQTRVKQGWNYYKNFIKAFPDIHKLAKAPDNKIFKLWEGLGYYNRCKNLIATARFISKEKKGNFPNTFEEIQALKGVGPYTAAAIASFAFNLPFAVVDGNVLRVLARFFGKKIPVDSTHGKKYFNALASQLLDKKRPGVYNQAIMDLGAEVCKPVSPDCAKCILKKDCLAFLNDKVERLPVKEKKIVIRKRRFYYLVMEYNNEILIRQRTNKDIWQQLFEFPMIETKRDEKVNTVLRQAEKNGLLNAQKYKLKSISPLYKQQLSHQLIIGNFMMINLKERPNPINGWIWTSRAKLNKYAFPKFINQYLLKKIA